jgi:hypothetical protein
MLFASSRPVSARAYTPNVSALVSTGFSENPTDPLDSPDRKIFLRGMIVLAGRLRGVG